MGEMGSEIKLDPDALNRFLAVHVLGSKWTGSIEEGGVGWVSDPNRPPHAPYNVEEFNPMENWADCEPLLETVKHDRWIVSMAMSFDRERWTVFLEKDHLTYNAMDERLAAALCLAIARAYGWKEPDGKG